MHHTISCNGITIYLNCNSQVTTAIAIASTILLLYYPPTKFQYYIYSFFFVKNNSNFNLLFLVPILKCVVDIMFGRTKMIQNLKINKNI